MKKITFTQFVVILSVALTVVSCSFLYYVVDTIIKYDNNQTDNYMARFIDNLKDTNYAITITGADSIKNSEFEKADASVRNGLAYLAQNDSLSFRLYSGKEEESPVFDIFDGDNPLVRVTLNAKERISRLGLYTFNVWEVKDVAVIKEGGLYDYEISVPNSCIVEVNGRKLAEKDSPDSLQFVGLSDISQKVGLSYQVTYFIEGLNDALDIKVTDKNGNPVECEISGQRCYKPLDCEKIADEATARTKIKNYPDVLSIAHEWSLYTSHDQHGGRAGFDNIEPLLVKGTYLYIYSLRWSRSVDITYVSNHGWDKERFTNECVSNFEIYSDKEFSCDVRFQKNLRVGHPLPEKFAERMHFVYYDDTDDGKDNPSWKILNMMSLPKMK